MGKEVTSSKEFAELVGRLHASPNDPVLKKRIVQNLPRMLALAKENPLALYHLALMYAPNSTQYKQTMRQAAQAGSTNAMLTMYELLLKSGKPSDLKRATHYFSMIEASVDTFIKEKAQALNKKYVEPAKPHQQVPVFNQEHRFFGSSVPKTEQSQEDIKKHHLSKLSPKH